MLNQEMGSIAKFVIAAAGEIKPYFHQVKENFATPSVYFPTPEIDSGAASLSSYYMDYQWFIQFFDRNTESAFVLARDALLGLLDSQRLVPIVDFNGAETGKQLRIKDPANIKRLGDGVYQLTLSWKSYWQYEQPDSQKMQRAIIECVYKQSVSDYFGESQ